MGQSNSFSELHFLLQGPPHVTVEDGVDKVPDRFELVLLAAHRARAIKSGSHITIEAENGPAHLGDALLVHGW